MGNFDNNKLEKLNQDLDLTRVKTRTQSGRSVHYLEGHDIITIANEIFGFGGWSYEPVGEVKTDKTGEGYLAKATVKVSVVLEDGTTISRTDIGRCAVACKAGEAPKADSVDTAEKGAVTDALKRALRSFGNQFGNSLYDKTLDLTGSGTITTTTHTPTVQTKKCTCGGLMTFREGVSKSTGKPYAGFYCANSKEKNCKPIYQ